MGNGGADSFEVVDALEQCQLMNCCCERKSAVTAQITATNYDFAWRFPVRVSHRTLTTNRSQS